MKSGEKDYQFSEEEWIQNLPEKTILRDMARCAMRYLSGVKKEKITHSDELLLNRIIEYAEQKNWWK